MLFSLLDLFFPRSHIASDLAAVQTDVYVEHASSLRNRGVTSLDALVSAVDYRGNLPVQRAVYALKYQRMSVLVRAVSALLLTCAEQRCSSDQVLVPVPLHWTRHLQRSFNQAALLVRFVSRKTHLPCRNLVKRTRDTGHQAWRPRGERLHAMGGAFALRTFATVPRHIVLIDDIATTGATLDACAKVLKAHGAETVEAWVVARG